MCAECFFKHQWIGFAPCNLIFEKTNYFNLSICVQFRSVSANTISIGRLSTILLLWHSIWAGWAKESVLLNRWYWQRVKDEFRFILEECEWTLLVSIFRKVEIRLPLCVPVERSSFHPLKHTTPTVNRVNYGLNHLVYFTKILPRRRCPTADKELLLPAQVVF